MKTIIGYLILIITLGFLFGGLFYSLYIRGGIMLPIAVFGTAIICTGLIVLAYKLID